MGDKDGMNVFLGHGVHKKIQFWSDAQGKEFAVRLSNEPDFRAVSNPSVKYLKLVEEADYFSDMNYDWKFLLEYWMGVKNGKIEPFGLNGKEEPNHITLDLIDTQTASVKADKKRIKRDRARPLLKCRYCMLSYNSEKERQEHELAWHAEKMKKDSSGQANNKLLLKSSSSNNNNSLKFSSDANDDPGRNKMRGNG